MVFRRAMCARIPVSFGWTSCELERLFGVGVEVGAMKTA